VHIRTDIGAALKHHVFKQMGEAGFPRNLIFGTDMIPDIYGNDGYVMIFMQYNTQPVIKLVFLK
jgi:hypothetical protein